MELVFVFAVAFIQVLFIDLFEIVQVIGAFGVHAFVEDEVLPVLFGDQGIAAVWAVQLHGRETAVLLGKPGIAYFAEYLPFGAIVFVEIWHRRITAWTGAVLRDIAFRATVYGPDLLSIALFGIREEFLISPVLAEVSNEGQFICPELLVFRGMGIVKSPLPEWDVSADEHDQPAVLLVKVLNEL